MSTKTTLAEDVPITLPISSPWVTNFVQLQEGKRSVSNVLVDFHNNNNKEQALLQYVQEIIFLYYKTHNTIYVNSINLRTYYKQSLARNISSIDRLFLTDILPHFYKQIDAIIIEYIQEMQMLVKTIGNKCPLTDKSTQILNFCITTLQNATPTLSFQQQMTSAINSAWVSSSDNKIDVVETYMVQYRKQLLQSLASAIALIIIFS
jgi:hypothetical protein